MNKFFIALYDFFESRRTLLYALLGVLVVAMASAALRLRFSENITGFFPDGERKAAAAFSNLKIKDKIAVMINAGEDAAAIAAALREMAERVDTSFVLDTLQYLWKGGRCSGVTALGANLLKLKPCLQMQEGKLVVGKKYRGPIDKVYRQYVAERFEGKDVLPEHVFITHSGGVAQETLDALVQQVQQAVPGCEVFITQAGCTVSSHCGPGTLGVLFLHRA